MGDNAATKPQRPVILVVCHTLSGHLQPLIRIAHGLSSRKWDRIEAAGVEFFALQGVADLNDQEYYANPDHLAPGYKTLPWTKRGKIDLRLQCLDTLPTQWENFKSTLAALHERDPGRQVLVVAEAFFLGILPLKYGAPLPSGVPAPLKTVCVSITVPAIQSVDLPPFAYAAPFDQSDAGRARNRALWDKWTESAAELTRLLDQQLLASGVGVPGFEYPRSDWPEGFKFVGLVQGTPKGTVLPDPHFEWWSELKANSVLDADDPRRKKVLVVAQGTVEVSPHDLIIPTIRAFAERNKDVLVVAILGWKDATLAEFMPDGVVPGNARIADYLNYDAVLEHADVWIHNAGFGAVNHGIAHGVPMVVAGEGMDKTENARRVGWSGIGVDLATAKPSVERVREAVESIIMRQGRAASSRSGLRCCGGRARG
ncbi:hypothetical protein PG997_003412 [Apiospora hydei]|uniref:Erythromycin biosynthesis protein CIII-like C-terminal domain-containing protein n=1 Tax=Apiospora hydei TaxID=1337664 RepID=A0ABR1WZ68_9PEZI